MHACSFPSTQSLHPVKYLDLAGEPQIRFKQQLQIAHTLTLLPQAISGNNQSLAHWAWHIITINIPTTKGNQDGSVSRME
jgi:hypothetical protein